MSSSSVQNTPNKSKNTLFVRKTTGVKDIIKEDIKQKYKFEKILGEGAFGKVKMASIIGDPDRKFAIKSIPRHLLDKHCKCSNVEVIQKADEMEVDKDAMAKLLNQEIDIVLRMDHPNIVKFYQCVYDNDYINIVMELVQG